MRTPTIGLFLLLAAAAPAMAEDTWYEYGTVLLSAPQWVAPGRGTVYSFDVPDYGPGVILMQPTPRACRKWARDGHPEWALLDELDGDAALSIRPHRDTNFLTGHFAYQVRLEAGEEPGHLCLRLPFVRGER